MYFKKLEIQGFKSFPDKIPLEFGSGITSIVGPNGSGKSNVADAVRWVLGEQSIKTLRGTRMEDVIFAGTEHRKPLGFAEVSITIDNSDGAFPVPYSEVTVTRRVFRSGESEYLLNKTSCRLKDITELFLDTGIGKDGYSIIGQGRIDEILSTKSEDRRHIFEEASGIMKYKVRKIEAEKKLEATRQNLLRINDIITELENQLEPLREQSETARRYLDLRENLKTLEVNVYIENLSKYKVRITELEGQYNTVRQDMDVQNAKLEEITCSNREKTESVKRLDELLENSRKEYYGIDGNLEQYRSEIKLNEQKSESLLQNAKRLDDEMAEIGLKLQNLDKEEDSRKKRVEYLNKQLEDFSSKLSEYEKRMEEILAVLDENERHIEELKSGIMDKLDLLSDKKTQINNTKSFIESLVKRQNGIDGEVAALISEKDRDGMKSEELGESIRSAGEAISRLSSAISAEKEEKSAKENYLEELRKKRNELASELQVRQSRSRMLEEMEKNLEGYSRSVREVLQTCSRSKEFGSGIHGALAQLITVESKYENAIEMTLGSALQNIVTSTEQDAKKAIEYLRRNNMGRATFLPISSVKGKPFDNDMHDRVSKEKGFIGIASKLVTYSNEYAGIIQNLLGKVAVVVDLDAGIGMARKYGYSFRIVTLEGDILHTSGSMSGGSLEQRSAGILSRHREITELKDVIEKTINDLGMLDKEIVSAMKALDAVSASIASKESELRDAELVKVRDESHLSQIRGNMEKTAARIEMLRQEKVQLKNQQAEVTSELVKCQDELNSIEKAIAESREIITVHQEKHKEGQSQRDALHRDITDFKISVNSINESLQAVKEAMDRIEGEKGSSVKNIAKKTSEKEKSLAEIKELEDKNEGIRQSIKNLEEEKSGKTFEMDRIAEEKKVLEEELAQMLDSVSEVNRSIIMLQEDAGRIDSRRSKLEAEMEAIQNRMWDEYELTYSGAQELRKDIGSITQAQKRINEYRNEIKELGPVNVAAIDEYIKTKERYEFMSSQRNDLEQAGEKLKRVIYEMTSIMKQQFMEHFKLINENFNVVFRELFDGGHARLVLSDEDNVLESGIEIEVQPPGKKLQNMMLLSGGERAFTAIALLFSILRMKPAPFCILDEIEATLDDANVYRFAEYLRKFTDTTQFIIITHRKGTMEASDVMYGVTMQEHGISKVVSMRMGEKLTG